MGFMVLVIFIYLFIKNLSKRKMNAIFCGILLSGQFQALFLSLP